MASPSPPDPYLALGVAKDADTTAIKSRYRKLVLKCHPDKIKDETQKQDAVDEFHKIQQAYEIIGDEDRRARYDAQCKLAELRREVIERQGSGARGVDVRTTAYKVPTDGPRAASFQTRGPERYERHERATPQYEERRPSFATDYFDSQPRSAPRKSAEHERSSKRAAPRGDRVRAFAKETKKSERVVREERNRRTDKDIRRDRDRKTARVDDDTGSDSDGYERRMREEDELRRAKDAYHEQARRQKEDAANGVYDGEQLARKLYSQYDGAREYMERSTRSRRPESDRRPSPVRAASFTSRDKVSYVKGRDGRPSVVRRDSNRPKTTGRDTERRRSPARDYERRASVEIVDEPRPRMPSFAQSKSSPADIRIPFVEKQRAHSVQIEREDSPPQIRRSETLPTPAPASRERESRRRRDPTAPEKSSSLRQTEFPEGLATPATTPEWAAPNPSKYSYGQEYADDAEYPTPDGYRTELRTPVTTSRPKNITRSPSPMRERGERGERSDRERPRTGSARYQTISPTRLPPMPRTTSTTYAYPSSQGTEHLGRPAISRENSARADRVDPLLYGEVRSTRSPKVGSGRYSPPPHESVRPQQFRPEDLRPQTGYGYTRRSSDSKPTYTRSGSSNPVYVR